MIRQLDDKVMVSGQIAPHEVAGLAEQHGVKTIAFPSISTGAYGFPMERAAKIAVTEIKKTLERKSSIEKVLLVCFGRSAFEVHQKAVRDMVG